MCHKVRGYLAIILIVLFFFNKQSINSDDLKTQTFAKTLLSNDFQRNFSIEKGSIPVRTDMDMHAFDACAQKSYTDFQDAQLVPSFSQNMATSSHLQSEMSKIISHYFTSEKVTAEQVAKQLSLAIRAVNK